MAFSCKKMIALALFLALWGFGASVNADAAQFEEGKLLAHGHRGAYGSHGWGHGSYDYYAARGIRDRDHEYDRHDRRHYDRHDQDERWQRGNRDDRYDRRRDDNERRDRREMRERRDRRPDQNPGHRPGFGNPGQQRPDRPGFGVPGQQGSGHPGFGGPGHPGQQGFGNHGAGNNPLLPGQMHPGAR